MPSLNINNSEGMRQIFNRLANNERVGAPDSMKCEILRVSTFRDFPDNKPYRTSFSKAGFYYANYGDEVVCYCCCLRRADWHPNDNPMEIHKRLKPNCPFFTDNKTVNVSVPDLSNTELDKFKCLDDLVSDNRLQAPIDSAMPVDTNSSHMIFPNAKYPSFQLENTRLETYRNWPSHLSQTPEMLAECGFMYARFSDCVRCFNCGLGLRNWSEEDDPWVEHARWSRNCEFVQIVRGQDFIDTVIQAISDEDETSAEEPQRNNDANNSITTVDDDDESPEETVSNILANSGQAILEMGYSSAVIERAIRRSLELEKAVNIDAQSIINSIFVIESEIYENEDLTGLVLPDDLNQQLVNLVLSSNDNSSKVSEHSSEISNEKTLNSEETSNRLSDENNQASSQASPNQSSLEVPSNQVLSEVSSEVLELQEKISQNNKLQMTIKQIKEENKKLKNQMICKICLDEEIQVLFLKCGHYVCCETCASSLRRCPICRKKISARVNKKIDDN